jgi:hypothetical protein
MRIKKNIQLEIAWSQFQRRFAPGFEETLEQGVQDELYDVDRKFDKYVCSEMGVDKASWNLRLLFRYLFIPWMQAQVDSYVDCVNWFCKCKDSQKVLPTGASPQEIYYWPHQFNEAKDFKVGSSHGYRCIIP